MPSVQVNGVSLDYGEQGTGQPVILVHGSVSDRRVWEPHVEALSDRFRVIAYSRRYHWPNEKIPDGADYSMNEHVSDLLELLRNLDAAPAHLVGSSYGAYLCLLAAMRTPDLVRTLVLAEPPVLPLFASNPPKPHEILRLLFTRPRAAVALIKLGAGGIGPATSAFRRGDVETGIRKFGTAVLGRETFESMPPERMEQVRANTIPAEFLGSGFASLNPSELRTITAPALLVTGENSPEIFSHFTHRLEELLPKTERVAIPNGSHNMHEANPPEFCRSVVTFLAQHAVRE